MPKHGAEGPPQEVKMHQPGSMLQHSRKLPVKHTCICSATKSNDVHLSRRVMKPQTALIQQHAEALIVVGHFKEKWWDIVMLRSHSPHGGLDTHASI